MVYNRILLVKPAGSSGLAFAIEPIPLGLEYIAARILQKVPHIKEKNIQIRDMFKDSQPFSAILRKYRPDLVAFSMSATEHNSGLELAQETRKYDKDILIVVGGYHPAPLPDLFLETDFCDVVCQTDGEDVMVEIIKGRPLSEINGLSFRNAPNEIIHNPDRELNPNLDEYPFPARYLRRYTYKNSFLMDRVFDQMMTSRGCTGKCSFCCEPFMSGSKTRFRSPENIMQEIREIYDYHKKKPLRILIGDPHFLVNPKRVDRLCDLILEANLDITFQVMSRTEPIAYNENLIEKMVRAGMVSWEVGIESYKQEDLNSTGKNVKVHTQEKAVQILAKYGGAAGGTFVIGLPQHNREDIIRIAEYARKIGLASAAFGIATPFPGTRFWDELKEQKLIWETNWSKFDENYNVFHHPTLSKAEIENLRTECMLRFWNIDTALEQTRLEIRRVGRFKIPKPTIVQFFENITRKMLFGVSAGSSLVEEDNAPLIENESENQTDFYDMMQMAFNTWADPRVKEYTLKNKVNEILELRAFTKFLGDCLIQIVVDDRIKNTCKLCIQIKVNKSERNIEYIDVSQRPALDYDCLIRLNFQKLYFNPQAPPFQLLKQLWDGIIQQDFVMKGTWKFVKMGLNALKELIQTRL